ncbi:hypothetical protein K2X33_10010, partial [bacterium]|nr:hypothetical protein [bacterium]
MSKSTRIFKRLGIFFAVCFGIMVIAAVVVPLIVDVDSFRPQIVEIANQNINGKVELGKLKLSLFGQIKIEVGGFAVQDSKGRNVLVSKDVYFHVPL